jgi:hypothetical protein
LLTPAAKAACRRATGAVAVDMESGSVARAAHPSPSRSRGSLPLPHAGEGRGEDGLRRLKLTRRLLPLPHAGEGQGEGAFRGEPGAALGGDELNPRAAIPFLVIRAIADPADRAVPAWVMQAVTADGRTALLPVLSHLGRHPGALPALVRLAGDAQSAMRSLRRVAALAGPFFAFDR